MKKFLQILALAPLFLTPFACGTATDLPVIDVTEVGPADAPAVPPVTDNSDDVPTVTEVERPHLHCAKISDCLANAADDELAIEHAHPDLQVNHNGPVYQHLDND